MTAPGSPVPVWLPPAVALAHWTEQARSQDSTASSRLRRLARNARWLVQHSQPTAAHGLYGELVVGEVPEAPQDRDVTAWARAAWDRAIEAGSAAERALAARARRMLTEGEAALRNIVTAIDRTTDSAVQATLRNIETGLRSILRPLSRGISTVLSPIGGPALLIGAGLVLLATSSRR